MVVDVVLPAVLGPRGEGRKTLVRVAALVESMSKKIAEHLVHHKSKLKAL